MYICVCVCISKYDYPAPPQRVPEKIRKFCEEDNFTLERRIIVTTCSSAMFLHEILSPGHFTHVFIDEVSHHSHLTCM